MFDRTWMVTFQVDVMVNSTSPVLELNKGAVSSSILKGAGQQMLVECQAKYPSGIQWGDIACTKGHGLACKEVFHTALQAWGKGGDHEVFLFCLKT